VPAGTGWVSVLAGQPGSRGCVESPGRACRLADDRQRRLGERNAGRGGKRDSPARFALHALLFVVCLLSPDRFALHRIHTPLHPCSLSSPPLYVLISFGERGQPFPSPSRSLSLLRGPPSCWVDADPPPAGYRFILFLHPPRRIAPSRLLSWTLSALCFTCIDCHRHTSARPSANKSTLSFKGWSFHSLIHRGSPFQLYSHLKRTTR